MEAKRITPRSPRAALEPESVPMPTRRSTRARHPLVIVGNALFTILVIVVVAGGVTFFIGKQWFEAIGPLPEDKVVNIPVRSGIRDIAELLQREGVIDKPWIFVAGILVSRSRHYLRTAKRENGRSALFCRQSNGKRLRRVDRREICGLRQGT